MNQAESMRKNTLLALVNIRLSRRYIDRADRRLYLKFIPRFRVAPARRGRQKSRKKGLP